MSTLHFSAILEDHRELGHFIDVLLFFANIRIEIHREGQIAQVGFEILDVKTLEEREIVQEVLNQIEEEINVVMVRKEILQQTAQEALQPLDGIEL